MFRNLGRPVLLVGCGGHATVLIETLRTSGAHVLAAVDNDLSKTGTTIAGVRIIGSDDVVFQHEPGGVLLVNGVGSVGRPVARKAVFDRFRKAGYNFATVVHPSAVIAADVELAEGAQVMAGVVIQPRSSVGMDTIVNTRAGIDHDGCIGAHVHIAPGATLCGNVTVGDECHIGAGATLIHGVQVAPHCVVGAGAVVLRPIASAGTYCGVPAKQRPD